MSLFGSTLGATEILTTVSSETVLKGIFISELIFPLFIPENSFTLIAEPEK